MTRPRRSKEWGYETEVAALRALRFLFPGLRRKGSVNYYKAAPDLVQEGNPNLAPINLIVTRDKRKSLLVTMSITDLKIITNENAVIPVRVQVKARQATWIGRLYEELRSAR